MSNEENCSCRDFEHEPDCHVDGLKKAKRRHGASATGGRVLNSGYTVQPSAHGNDVFVVWDPNGKRFACTLFEHQARKIADALNKVDSFERAKQRAA